MGSNDAALKRYYHSVSNALPCSRKTKKQIIFQLQTSIRDYLEQNPDADFSAVHDHFGSPEQIASGYVDDQTADALLKRMSIKKRVITIIACIMTTILVIWATAMVWAIVDQRNARQDYIEVAVGEE